MYLLVAILMQLAEDGDFSFLFLLEYQETNECTEK